MIPFEIVTATVSSNAPTSKTVRTPLYGWLVFVEPDSARIVVTLLVLVRAGSGRPRLVRVIAASAV